MEANELMIGDWVECIDTTHKEKVYAQIDAIEEGKICILVRLDNCNWFLDISFIKPIPLTSDILEKNDFIRDIFYGEWQFDLDPFPFSVVQRGNNSWYLGREESGIAHNREIIDISYVHELQHALKLCRIKKELVLETPKGLNN